MTEVSSSSAEVPSHVDAKSPSAQAALDEQVKFASEANHEVGLTESEAKARYAKYGPNALPEKTRNPILVFLSYFWGPMPIMIWIAVIVELIKGILINEGWEDFAVLLVLQFANAIVGYIEESKSGDAIAALKSSLKPKTFLCRDGNWRSEDAILLVPGDLIQLKIGDVIPADCIYIEKAPLEVDQAALTGESLPVTIHFQGHLKMGSALKRGEGNAIVVATGQNTFLGTAAKLMSEVHNEGRLQKIILQITAALLLISIVLCVVIFAFLMTLTEDDRHIAEGGDDKFMSALSIVIVILVASIPIAIEVVCTSTLAVGSHSLSAKKVIVARLSAIEELAGMTILCSDKTGTLTLNELSLREPICMGKMTKEELIFYAAMSSKQEKGNQDAIDFCITNSISEAERKSLATYKIHDFMPFNPTDKRTEVTVEGPDGRFFKVTKGAPQYIQRLAHNAAELEQPVYTSIQELADRGFRAVGLAISYTGPKEKEHWEFQGIISLFDPPRHDTKDTITNALTNGIEVKMITGDQLAIAKETCRELGMGVNVLNTSALDVDMSDPDTLAIMDRIIMEAHGFAEVMPEHKFLIVERIRHAGHVTGMTGDGVNDAPALKRADIGIAVHGATDAARAAADLVLTEPGLSVIIDAIFESRMIFQRMRNYVIYRIACTVQLLLFFFFAILCINPDSDYMYGNAADANFEGDLAHGTVFFIPVISLVLITILNDGCMIAIAYDHVIPEKIPQKWNLTEITIVSSVVGLVACISSLILLAYGMHANALHPDTVIGHVWGVGSRNYITWYELRTILYLKISISDFLTLFCSRTRSWFWERPPGRLLLAAAMIAMICSTLFSLFWDEIFEKLPGAQMEGLRNSETSVIATLIYCIVWMFVQDICKVGIYAFIDLYIMKDPITSDVLEKAGTPARERGASRTDGSIGRMNLPSGVDLNMILTQATQESIRQKKAREAREAVLSDATFQKPAKE